MDHEEARMLASARSDGELDPSRFADLDEHLAGCDGCRTFAGALPQLSALAAALPREHAPADLARRVRDVMRERPVVLASRRRWRVAPALAAVVVVAIVAVTVGTVPIVQVPTAEAARALARIETLYVEREVTTFDEDGGVREVTRERIWFKAPGIVRTETQTGDERVLVIEGPGYRYREDRNGKFLNTGLLPALTPLPEPLTPTLSLIGTDIGPGPVILGRTTRRISVEFQGQRREALVDAERFTVLGMNEGVVLGKETVVRGRVAASKRTLALEYNPRLDGSLFEIPEEARVIENGARSRPLGSLTAPPAGRLEGLTVVAAAQGAGVETILYADGAFQVAVRIDGPDSPPSLARRQAATIGSRPATVYLPLYGLPEIRFTVGTHRIAIQAPLPPAVLQELALRMYPERE